MSATDEILEAEHTWIRIYLANDADGLAGLLVDDFTYVSPVGEQVDRETYLVNLRDDIVHMDRIEPKELAVRFYGQQDVAVVSGTWLVKERYRDTTADGAFRFIRVWSRDGDGHWRAAAFQVTAVPGAE